MRPRKILTVNINESLESFKPASIYLEIDKDLQITMSGKTDEGTNQLLSSPFLVRLTSLITTELQEYLTKNKIFPQ